MFSGIVEEAGIITNIKQEGENVHFSIACSFVNELHIDQSIAHNGVCLTVVDKTDKDYTVTAIKETMDKTSLGHLSINDKVNLERSMKADGRIDGHFVQGHVDQTAICTDIQQEEGSWYFTFEYNPTQSDYITVEKGSISVDGISLTVVNSQKNSFQVAIIPYTYEITNFHQIQTGTTVNLEFDIIGKYISKIVKEELDNRIQDQFQE